jgi:PiT family inorganic phosphate transporter
MMAASITVVIASQLGLPVSSTHIAVGAIFGVGFLREWLDSKKLGEQQIAIQKAVEKQNKLKSQVAESAKNAEYKKQVELIEAHKAQKKKVKNLKRSMSEKYVKRDLVKKIISAWVITVPAAAVLSGMIFFILKGVGV